MACSTALATSPGWDCHYLYESESDRRFIGRQMRGRGRENGVEPINRSGCDAAGYRKNIGGRVRDCKKEEK